MEIVRRARSGVVAAFDACGAFEFRIWDLAAC